MSNNCDKDDTEYEYYAQLVSVTGA